MSLEIIRGFLIANFTVLILSGIFLFIDYTIYRRELRRSHDWQLLIIYGVLSTISIPLFWFILNKDYKTFFDAVFYLLLFVFTVNVSAYSYSFFCKDVKIKTYIGWRFLPIQTVTLILLYISLLIRYHGY